MLWRQNRLTSWRLSLRSCDPLELDEIVHERNQLGSQTFKLNDRLHRPDGPAWIGTNGDQAWWLYGERHRTDGPAVVGTDGHQQWWQNGLWHRSDGPAIICKHEGEQWWLNGVRHRSDGPAIIGIGKHADEQWWLNGVRHRTHGPALTDANGRQTWWIQGKEITNQVNLWMQQQQVTWPWDAETQAEFVLTWC